MGALQRRSLLGALHAPRGVDLQRRVRSDGRGRAVRQRARESACLAPQKFRRAYLGMEIAESGRRHTLKVVS